MACQLTWRQFWSLTHTKGTQLLLGWNVVALLKPALRSLKCMIFTCPGCWAGHNAQELYFVTPCGYVLAYLPTRLPLSTAPDCARKTGLTCRRALRAADWEVRRKWLRGPDELTNGGRNVQMKPHFPRFWMPKALESAPLFFGQEVAKKWGIFKALLEQQEDVSLLWFLRYLIWEMNRISSLDNKEWGYFFPQWRCSLAISHDRQAMDMKEKVLYLKTLCSTPMMWPGSLLAQRVWD